MRDGVSRALHQRFLPDNHLHAYVWKYAQSIGGRRPRHFHSEPELNLVIAGSATFGIGDRIVNASRGDLVAFSPGQDHALLAASPDLYLYAIGLEPAYSTRVLGAAFEAVGPLHVRLPANEFDGVVDRAAAIVDRPDAEQLGAELWERINWLGRGAVDRVGHRTHVVTRRALQLMLANPEVGLDALAAELRTHPSEISRHFHRDVGTTLVRHRTRLRLLRLIRLVDSGARDLMSAAGESGFGSYSQCHRAFRAELACAPREFFFSGVRDRMQNAYDG
jgi:AraC-like DNA-binding protein